MPEALITPDVLKWARKRARFTKDGAAKRVQVRPDRLLAWEEGEYRPTFRQAQKLAKAFHVPFGYLFLPSPPREEIKLPDLRSVGGMITPDFSLEFVDLYNEILRKQEWFRDFRIQEGAGPLSFIGKFSEKSDYREVAHDIYESLSIDELRSSAGSWEQFISRFIEQIENNYILVMRSSIVGNNAHRQLSVDEFRGLAISDTMAPPSFSSTPVMQSLPKFSLLPMN